MNKLPILIILIIVITVIGCDYVDRPFSRDRFKEEGYPYLEKYSKKFWTGEFDSIVNSLETQQEIAELKNIIGDRINDTKSMLLANSGPYDYDIWYVDSKKYISLFGSENYPSISQDFKRVQDCILEMYTLDAECGGWYRIYYLRKGKQLIPISYSYLPKDIEWME